MCGNGSTTGMGNYLNGVQTDPEGPASGSDRVGGVALEPRGDACVQLIGGETPRATVSTSCRLSCCFPSNQAGHDRIPNWNCWEKPSSTTRRAKPGRNPASRLMMCGTETSLPRSRSRVRWTPMRPELIY